MADLSDNINQMIANLRETTRQNEEQDWLKTNLARISGLMQGQRDLETVSQLIMSELSPAVAAQHGAFFIADHEDEEAGYELTPARRATATRAGGGRQPLPPGEALVGQAALEKKPILINDPPPDYIHIASGLGEAAPRNIIVIPVLFEEQVLAVIELASFRAFSEIILQFLDQLTETIGVVLSTIIANVRTEQLLEQSQSQGQELQKQSQALQTQQEELRATNEELQEKAEQLERQNRDIEIKNREIEMARASLEEKAEQLALSSKYKSEFLANMSHELRTPLNSLLILSKVLSSNETGNLTSKQVDSAARSTTRLGPARADQRHPRPVQGRGRQDGRAPGAHLAGGCARLRRALLPAARGGEGPVVRDRARARGPGQHRDRRAAAPAGAEEPALERVQVHRARLGQADDRHGCRRPAVRGRGAAHAERVVAFSVSDSGIGIPPDKLRLIFEAFQQAEGSISRRFGGTGLGLSISREIARLLGGEIRVESVEGEGATFTLYLPMRYRPLERRIEAVEPPEPPEIAAYSNGAPRGQSATLPEPLTDDRADLAPGDRVALVMSEDRSWRARRSVSRTSRTSSACWRCAATPGSRSYTSSCRRRSSLAASCHRWTARPCSTT